MSNLLKFINLPPREKTLFFQAVYYLLVFRIRLALTPPKILFAEVAKTSGAVVAHQPCCVPPVRIARIINQVSRFVPYSTCLSKALAGSVLFARNDCAADLHIGVLINDNRQLEAHAWLSYDGKIVIGNMPDLGLYQELPLKSKEDTL